MNTWPVTIDDNFTLVVFPHKTHKLQIDDLTVGLTWQDDGVRTAMEINGCGMTLTVNPFMSMGFNGHKATAELVR
jgi:hypothetical protein